MDRWPITQGVATQGVALGCPITPLKGYDNTLTPLCVLSALRDSVVNLFNPTG
jgi:hypothetical protein